MYGSNASSGFGLHGSSKPSLLSAPSNVEALLQMAGKFEQTSPTEKAYVHPSKRQGNQRQPGSSGLRGEYTTNRSTNAVAAEMIELVSNLKPTSPMYSESSATAEVTGAVETKQEADFDSPQDFLFRDLKKSPEERRAIQRIRQPMSPLIQQLSREMETKAMIERESKPVQIAERQVETSNQSTGNQSTGNQSTGNQSTGNQGVNMGEILSLLSSQVVDKAPAANTNTCICVAISSVNRVWRQKIYAFDNIDFVKTRDFTWAEDYCRSRSVASFDTDSYLMVELPAHNIKGSLWVRVIGNPNEDGTIPFYWTPICDDKRNVFLQSIGRPIDFFQQFIHEAVTKTIEKCQETLSTRLDTIEGEHVSMESILTQSQNEIRALKQENAILKRNIESIAQAYETLNETVGQLCSYVNAESDDNESQ